MAKIGLGDTMAKHGDKKRLRPTKQPKLEKVHKRKWTPSVATTFKLILLNVILTTTLILLSLEPLAREWLITLLP